MKSRTAAKRTTQASSRRSYAGRPAGERSAERRARLIQAGLDLFGSQGYANVTIERLCKTSRVSTRYFYEHFTNREALLLAVLEQVIEHGRVVIIEAMARPGTATQSPTERSLDALRAFLHYYMDEPTRARIGTLETVGISHAMESRRRKVIHELADIVSLSANTLSEAGVLPAASYRLSGVALVGATNELIAEWLLTDTGLDVDDMIRQIVALYRAMILGSELINQRRNHAAKTHSA